MRPEIFQLETIKKRLQAKRSTTSSRFQDRIQYRILPWNRKLGTVLIQKIWNQLILSRCGVLVCSKQRVAYSSSWYHTESTNYFNNSLLEAPSVCRRLNIISPDDINDMPFTTPLSAQIAKWWKAYLLCHQRRHSCDAPRRCCCGHFLNTNHLRGAVVGARILAQHYGDQGDHTRASWLGFTTEWSAWASLLLMFFPQR